MVNPKEAICLSDAFHFSVEGYHGRLAELSAAVLRVKLEKIDAWITERRRIAATYNELLGKLDVVQPVESEDVEHIYRNYAVRLKNRDNVRIRLAEMGVVTGMHYVPPLHLQPVYKRLGYGPNSLPVTEKVSSELCTLPIYPQLSGEQVKWVAKALEKSIQECGEA